MKVAFLHPSQGFGQQIRVRAFQEFFKQNNLDFVDCKAGEIFSHRWIDKIIRLPLRFSASKQFSAYCKSAAALSETFVEKVKDCDYIHAENHEGALIAAFLKEKIKKPLIFDMHGLAVEEALGRNEKPREIAFARALEKYVVERADRILVVSEIMAEYLSVQYQFPIEQIEIIACGSTVYKDRAHFEQPVKVVYAGGCGYYERVHDYLRLPKVFKEKFPALYKQVEFHHIGRWPKNFDRNYFAGKIWGVKTREDTLKLLKSMQVAVAPSTNDLTRKCASPVKVADYAACGLPIICPDVGEWSDNIKQFSAGTVCSESSPEAFSQALSELITPSIWAEKSEGALKMIRERYEWNLVLKPLYRVYDIDKPSYEQSSKH